MAEATAVGAEPAAARLRAALLRGEIISATRADSRRRASVTRTRVADASELSATAQQFGADSLQVRRDHLISHLLAALSTNLGSAADNVVFIGGTALSRTVLPSLRLSEDIDLLTDGPRSVVARAIVSAMSSGMRRTHGRLSWAGPTLGEVSDTDPAVAVFGDLQVRIQLLPGRFYPPWPREPRSLVQRYSDAPPATLPVLTNESFVASKLSAWHDRSAARDLYDLWALGVTGHFDAEAVRLFQRFGPTGGTHLSFTPPSEEAWTTALAHQGRIRLRDAEAAAEVERLWRHAVHNV